MRIAVSTLAQHGANADMKGVALAILAAALSYALGAGSVYLYLLNSANSEWRTATEQARAATTEALAAERRLANAQTKRQQAAQQLQANVSASNLRDCPVSADVAGMLAAAAAESRAGTGASKTAR